MYKLAMYPEKIVFSTSSLHRWAGGISRLSCLFNGIENERERETEKKKRKKGSEVCTQKAGESKIVYYQRPKGKSEWQSQHYLSLIFLVSLSLSSFIHSPRILTFYLLSDTWSLINVLNINFIPPILIFLSYKNKIRYYFFF